MTEFRRQLASARSAHQSARYPGDLAADVLGAAGARRSLWWQIGAGAVSAAALLAFAVWLGSGRVEVQQLATDDLVPQDQIFAITTFPALGTPELPLEMSFAIETPSFIFSSPEFPSIIEINVESNSNEKETS